MDMTLDVTHFRNSNIQMCLRVFGAREFGSLFNLITLKWMLNKNTEQNWLSRDTRDESTRAPQWHMAYRQTTTKKERIERGEQVKIPARNCKLMSEIYRQTRSSEKKENNVGAARILMPSFIRFKWRTQSLT